MYKMLSANNNKNKSEIQFGLNVINQGMEVFARGYC